MRWEPIHVNCEMKFHWPLQSAHAYSLTWRTMRLEDSSGGPTTPYSPVASSWDQPLLASTAKTTYVAPTSAWKEQLIIVLIVRDVTSPFNMRVVMNVAFDIRWSSSCVAVKRPSKTSVDIRVLEATSLNCRSHAASTDARVNKARKTAETNKRWIMVFHRRSILLRLRSSTVVSENAVL